MMAQKAIIFADYETLKKIMQSTNPQEQKKLGREVKEFDANKWEHVCKMVMMVGLLEKFDQNKDLYDAMMSTGERRFVEASPYDKIWGIGMGVENPDIHDSSKWQGKNYLGEVLTMIKKHFLDRR